MNMSELEQKRKEWVAITRKNGFREGIADFLAHQYSKKTHFIFELLQNAEDALANEVEFYVESQRLVFIHNGKKLFSDKNVESITSIGKSTKQTDYTQIGKHGIGFKAVFAYTHTPQIHSGDKHFDIEDVVIPCFLNDDEIPTDLKPEETRIILPFDSDSIPEHKRFREFVSAETAVADISDALKKLNIRTLLFLRHIKKIRWTLLDGNSRIYSRHSKRSRKHKNLCHVSVTDGAITESWIVFKRETSVTDDGKDHECIIEVAFLVINNKVVPASNTELVVYFPTGKKTGLSFLIQGPFKTTKARNDIKDDDVNQNLLKAAAQLAADSLEIMRGRGLIDLNSYKALPLRKPEDSFFHPVYNIVRQAFKEKPLLPLYGGGFTKPDKAKLPRGKDLVEQFSPKQLGMLFGKNELSWLDASITDTGPFADLHTYMVGQKKYQGGREWEIEPLCDGLLVDAESLVPKLTADFFGQQPIAWLIKFIQYIMKPQSSSELKRTPFIRLVSDKQVALPTNEKVPRPAWFAPADGNGLDLKIFPLVHQELSTNENIRNFLEKEGIREIDAIALVEKSILPKYHDTKPCFDESTYRVDLHRIREAYRKANDAEKAQLKNILNRYEWLASVHASGNAPDKIVWEKPGASDLLEKTADHKNWFEGLEDIDVYFLHPSVIETLSEAVTSLTKATTRLTMNLSENEDTIELHDRYEYKLGLKGFNPNATVVGIESAIANWSQERSKILWKVLLSSYPLKIISGETQSSKNRQKLKKAAKKVEYSDVGKICREHAWLYDKSGNRCKPSELLLTDLPEGFESTSITAKELSAKLDMKQPEREQAIEIVTGGDPDRKMRLERFLSASDNDQEKMLKIIPREIPPEPAPSFKNALKSLGRMQSGEIEKENTPTSPVSDLDRYQGKLNGDVEAGVREHESTPRKISFNPVRNNPSNAEARRFLYEQYNGHCQITGSTFPKASRNTDGTAENYFEACTLLSYSNANYLNDAGNMLCLSADTMAKFKYASVEFLEDIEDAIEKFNTDGKSSESILIRIRLAEEEHSIRWSQRHFMHLIALYERT